LSTFVIHPHTFVLIFSNLVGLSVPTVKEGTLDLSGTLFPSLQIDSEHSSAEMGADSAIPMTTDKNLIRGNVRIL
jgi:hypothetical protein